MLWWSPAMNSGNRDVTRRVLLGRLSLLGIGTSAFQRALADEATRANALTDVQISNAEWISGLMLSETDRGTKKPDTINSCRYLARNRMELSTEMPKVMLKMSAVLALRGMPK